MYEATVSVEKQNEHLLNYARNKLQQSVSAVGGIGKDLQTSTRCYYSLACDDTYKFQMSRAVADTAALALSIGYKNLYVRNLLGIDGQNFYQNVLVNTICAFDTDQDKQHVLRLVNAQHPIFLDGYYNFKLRALKNKWKEITTLIVDNSFVLTDSNLICEFVQYLLESSPHKVRELSVSFDNDNTSFSLYGTNNKVICATQSLAQNSAAQEEAMLNVICLKPQKVTVYHGQKLSQDFCNMLERLFDATFITVR